MRSAEPDVYEQREAIKARWHELSGENWAELTRARQKWLNTDAENLARKCADTPEALAVMQAVYDFAWRDGRRPYRAPFRLRKVVELVKAYREGDLGGCPPLTPQQEQDVGEALGYFEEHFRPILDDELDRFRAWALSGVEGFGLRDWLGTARCLATDPFKVGNPRITPDDVTRMVAFWQDNGKPRTARELDERKKRHIQNGRR